jgi:uncharacterized protein
MDKFKEASDEWDKGNFDNAINLFLSLAEEGDVSSMEKLACIYGDGIGVDFDFEKSVYWDKKAIESGSLVSLGNLAITYRTKGDIQNAKKWFEKAIEAGDGDAAFELAKLYMVSEKENEKIVDLLNIAINSEDLVDDSLEEAKSLLSDYT